SRRPSAGRGRRYAARTPAAPEGAPRSRAHSPRRGRAGARLRPTRRRSRHAHECRPSRSPIRFRGRSPRSLAYSARSWATASFQVSCSPTTSPVDRFTTAYFRPRFTMSQGIVRPPSYVVRCGEDHAALPERGSFCALRVRVGEEMAGTRDRTFAVVQYRVSRPTVAVDAAPATIPGEPCLVVACQLPQQLRRRLQLAGDAGDLPDDLLQRFASQAVGAEAQGDRPALDALHAVQFLS